MTNGSYIGEIVLSGVDGPGLRAMIHFAGCSIGCPGCFNPHTHDGDADGVWSGDAQSVARSMLAVSPSASISGGEPTDQPFALMALLRALKAEGVSDVVMFTGRRVEWLEAKRPTLWNAIVREALVDVIIDGPFVKSLLETGDVTRGSSNQRIIVLTDKLSESDFNVREVQILSDGDRLIITGFPSVELLEAINSSNG